jgi:hypothetical protein
MWPSSPHLACVAHHKCKNHPLSLSLVPAPSCRQPPPSCPPPSRQGHPRPPQESPRYYQHRCERASARDHNGRTGDRKVFAIVAHVQRLRGLSRFSRARIVRLITLSLIFLTGTHGRANCESKPKPVHAAHHRAHRGAIPSAVEGSNQATHQVGLRTRERFSRQRDEAC